jgi:hypothetical protein
MEAYLGGGHAYHATMPTDALAAPKDTSQQCIRVFPTSWAAFMMMPCWTGLFR